MENPQNLKLAFSKKGVTDAHGRRNMNEIFLGSVSKKNIPDLLSIADKRLGESYIVAKDLAGSENIVYEALLDNKPIGFVIGKTFSSKGLQSNFPKVFDAISQQISVFHAIGFVSSIAVDICYERSGVGRGLMGVLLQELDAKFCETIIMLGWKKRGANRPEIAGLAERYGFEAVREFPEYWKEESQKLGYRCPSCGDPPCLCNAVLFVRHGVGGSS